MAEKFVADFRQLYELMSVPWLQGMRDSLLLDRPACDDTGKAFVDNRVRVIDAILKKRGHECST